MKLHSAPAQRSLLLSFTFILCVQVKRVTSVYFSYLNSERFFWNKVRWNIYGFKGPAATSSRPENVSLNIFVHGINTEIIMCETTLNPLLVDFKNFKNSF